MSDADLQNTAELAVRKLTRRERRAARARAKALSPLHISLSIIGIPFIAASVAVSIYVRTSPFEPRDALRHLVAQGGCDAAMAVGLAPARRGQPGYHAKNDPDGDGVACLGVRTGRSETAPKRSNGGAKFVRP